MAYKNFLQKLGMVMDKFQAEAELGLILEFVDFQKKDLLIGKTLSQEQIQKIEEIIKLRTQSRAPIQHILGYGYFMGEKFEVTPDVLIPRPETELLVEQVLNLSGKTVLDIGTGSGCIAIMAQKLSDKEVWSCDISEKALEIAQKNAQNLGAEVNFLKSDLFSNINQKFDIIVSNPPYITHSAKSEMTVEVLENEPHLALFADDSEGVDFYKKIIKDAPKYLNPKGFIAFELGINQHEKVTQLLAEQNFENIRVIQDFAKIERIIIAQMP